MTGYSRFLQTAHLRIFFALIFVAGCSLTRPAEPDRVDRWRKDLRYLAAELPARHVNPFFQVTRDEFDRAIDGLDKEIPFLKDFEVIVRMKQILAMIGDPHTFLKVNFGYYPLRLSWFKDGYYVTGTTSAYREILSSRLIQIGSTDVESAYSAVKKVISADNEVGRRKASEHFLLAPAVLKAFKILPQSETGQFIFEDAMKNRVPVDLRLPKEQIDWIEKPDAESVPLYQKKSHVYYWYEYLEEFKTLYFQYNRCREMEALPFAKFSDELLKGIDTLPVARLIIDLRYNVGGDSGILWRFLQALRERPAINQKGRLFVVIGPETNSSGILNAAELQQYTNAVLVGEPTGAKPNMYGQIESFPLPNSSLEVFYSTNYFMRVKDDPPALIPDIAVVTTADDFFAGHDPVMDRILAGEIQ
jgi:hypothetical protein